MAIKEFPSRAKARQFAKENGGHLMSPQAPWMVQYESTGDVYGPSDLDVANEAAKNVLIAQLRDAIQAARNEAMIADCYEALNAANLGEPITSELDEEIGLRTQAIEADAQMNRAQVAGVADVKNGQPWIRASTIEKPTKAVWAIADELVVINPEISRKEVMAECVARGIASGTARTQYQHWFKQRNESANEVRATIVDGKIVPAAK